MPAGFPDDGWPTEILWAFGLFAVFFVLVLTLGITTTIRSRRVLEDAGLDPLAAGAQLAARLANSRLVAPARSTEDRLRELTGLRDRGVITTEEYAAARAEILIS
jgi:hypothetical protein